jgi:hypothetical protein
MMATCAGRGWARTSSSSFVSPGAVTDIRST